MLILMRKYLVELVNLLKIVMRVATKLEDKAAVLTRASACEIAPIQTVEEYDWAEGFFLGWSRYGAIWRVREPEITHEGVQNFYLLLSCGYMYVPTDRPQRNPEPRVSPCHISHISSPSPISRLDPSTSNCLPRSVKTRTNLPTSPTPFLATS